MRVSTSSLWLGVVCLFALQANAGTIIVSGDSNISDNLAGKPGNARFFANVLGAGTSVFVLDTTPSLCCLGPFDDTINTFYNTLPGVVSTKSASPITAAGLAGVNLVVALAPNLAFTAPEAAALSGYLSGGGTLFLMGDNDGFPGENANVNNLLISLGSGLRIVEDMLDAGFNNAIVLPNPLTAGVGTLEYAATSRVTGGTALLQSLQGFTFAAVENTPNTGVPEPSAYWTVALGLGAIALSRTRRG